MSQFKVSLDKITLSCLALNNHTYTNPSDTLSCLTQNPKTGIITHLVQDFAFKTNIFGVGAMA